MKSLRILIPGFVFVLAFVAWGVWWSIVADGVAKAIASFMESGPSRGVHLSYDSVEIDGFPFRVTAAFKNLRIESRNGSWSADSFAVDMLPYRFDHFVFRAEGRQRFESKTPDGTETLEIGHTLGLGSVLLAGGQPARIDVDLRGASVYLRDAFGAETQVDARRLQMHALRSVVAGTMAAEYELAFSVNDATLGSGFAPLLGTQVAAFNLKGSAPGFRLNTVTTPDQAMSGFSHWLGGGGRLNVDELRLIWGGVDVTGAGQFGQDSRRRPDGRFDLRIKGYRNLLAALVREGWLARDDALLTGDVGDLFSGVTGDYVPIPLTLDGGFIYLGPARIGVLAPMR